MVDQLSPVETCRACGTPIRELGALINGLCQNCAAQQIVTEPQPGVAYPGYDQHVAGQAWPGAAPLDPDHPRWGPLTGIGVWLFSVAATIAVPVVAMVAWIFIAKARGTIPPEGIDQDSLPIPLLLTLIYSTVFAHLIIVLFCWAVVTNLKKQPFLASLGWHWGGRSVLYWVLVSIGIVIGIMALGVLLSKLIPEKESDFAKMLKASQSVRVAVALLASFSAPFVEEMVYRGVLYSGLRKRLGQATTVILVMLLFAGVHVPQYWGAWPSIIGLAVLSLILTVVRAKTKSILPCVTIHFIHNFIISVLIVVGMAD
jgi:membrane protease YdiL (CAAX protease family)